MEREGKRCRGREQKKNVVIERRRKASERGREKALYLQEVREDRCRGRGGELNRQNDTTN